MKSNNPYISIQSMLTNVITSLMIVIDVFVYICELRIFSCGMTVYVMQDAGRIWKIILTVAESIILVEPSCCQGIFNSGEII